MPKYVPLDLLTREELYVVVFQAIGRDVPKAIVDKMTDALVAQQGGIEHELSQAWERGVSDCQQAIKYPWILAHMVSPYIETEVDTDSQTG